MHGKFANAGLLDPWPKDTGPRRITFRGGALHSLRPPASQDFVPRGHWIGIILAPAKNVQIAFGSDKTWTTDPITGMLAINPAGLDGRASWATPLENAIVSIAPESMLELAGDEFDCACLEIRPTHLTFDPTALQFGRLLKAELNNPDGGNELYLDSLITVFGIYVLRNYSSIAKRRKSVTAGLTTTAAKRVQDYLHEHFRRKITITELAKICGLSPSYFAESFTKTFGIPPHRYLMERRLEFAERLLRETEIPIPEVAFLSGFSSQSHLTNMIRVHRGKTPKQLRSA